MCDLRYNPNGSIWYIQRHSTNEIVTLPVGEEEWRPYRVHANDYSPYGSDASSSEDSVDTVRRTMRHAPRDEPGEPAADEDVTMGDQPGEDEPGEDVLRAGDPDADDPGVEDPDTNGSDTNGSSEEESDDERDEDSLTKALGLLQQKSDLLTEIKDLQQKSIRYLKRRLRDAGQRTADLDEEEDTESGVKGEEHASADDDDDDYIPPSALSRTKKKRVTIPDDSADHTTPGTRLPLRPKRGQTKCVRLNPEDSPDQTTPETRLPLRPKRGQQKRVRFNLEDSPEYQPPSRPKRRKKDD